MSDLKALLDKYHKENPKSSPNEPLMNGSVVVDDNLSDLDGPSTGVNGHVNDTTAFIPGTSGSYTGTVYKLSVISKALPV